jgi:ubiquinone/menaquinone biosynthesis C-methylase UbiE
MDMGTDTIRERSRAVWAAMARGWDDRHSYFERAARPVTEVMLDRVGPRPGEYVLELAAGTGVVGFAAAQQVGPDGRVIVSDFAEGMVDAARRHAARLGLDNVVARVLDAERLQFDGDAFDGVVCRWGLMLMPDPAAALAESRRVLRPGGRLAAAVFAGPVENPWAALPMQVLVERGLVEPPQPGAPGILALADKQRLEDLVTGAGFADVIIEDVAFSWPFRGADEYWAFLLEAAGAIARLIEGLGDDDRDAVCRDLFAHLEPFQTDAGLELPAVAVVASAC